MGTTKEQDNYRWIWRWRTAPWAHDPPPIRLRRPKATASFRMAHCRCISRVVNCDSWFRVGAGDGKTRECRDQCEEPALIYRDQGVGMGTIREVLCPADYAKASPVQVAAPTDGSPAPFGAGGLFAPIGPGSRKHGSKDDPQPQILPERGRPPCNPGRGSLSAEVRIVPVPGPVNGHGGPGSGGRVGE